VTFADGNDVAAYALTLAGTEPSTSWGRPAIELRGKPLCSTGREPDSFHVSSRFDGMAVLLDSNPDTFWQRPHYANWPGLLVRYGSRDPDRIRAVIARAWWDRATQALRAAYGPRP